MSNTEIISETPVTWETVRSGLAQTQILGRQYLLGKAFVGWQLSVLKSANCRIGAGRPKNSAESAELIPWPELVKRETGLGRRAADELIRLWEAGLAKHKRLRGPLQNRALLSYLETSDPLAINNQTSTEAAEFCEHFASICDGETAATLMAELGVIPKPKPMPAGGKPKGSATDTAPTAGQLAFHFFDAVAAPLINARTNPDYQKLLYALPFESDEENPLSLATLEAEFRAALADIEEVKSQAHKAARGKTINV